MKLPKRFQLAGHTIRVSHKPQADSEDLGEFDRDDYRITIFDTGGPDAAANTFYHELVHAVLHTMGRHDLDEDEAFVDLLGSLLYQARKTEER